MLSSVESAGGGLYIKGNEGGKRLDIIIEKC